MSMLKINISSLVMLLCLVETLTCIAQPEVYTFHTVERNVYCIQNPFDDPKDVWVVHQTGTYQPYYIEEENRFAVIGLEDAVFQLLQTTEEFSLPPLPLWDTKELRKKNIYRHSILENQRSDNWLTALLRKNNRFRDTIYIGHLSENDVPAIELKLHNFHLHEPNRFSIRLNNQIIDTLAEEFGGLSFRFNFETTKEDPKYLVFEIEPFKGDLGLVGYHLKTKIDRIDYEQNFQSYISEDDLNFAEVDDQNFYHFYFDKYKMIKLQAENLSKINAATLLVKHKKTIKECLLKKADFVDLVEKSIDVLLVYNELFMPAMDSLLVLYKNIRPNAKVKAVDVQAIYNSYSKGTKDPSAIQTYLWKVQPKEVCLIGDANANERRDKDLIPTFYFKQMMKETRVPSDFLYALSPDSSHVGFAIGRLPFENAETLLRYIHKVEQYIALPPSTTHKLMLYDDSEHPMDINTVRQNPSLLYKRPNPKTARFEKNIVQWSNRYDCLNIAYYGHGAFSGWRENNRVDIRMYEELQADRLFMLFDFSCLTGEFSFPFRKSFSEELLAKPNGPVAIVGSSGFVKATIYKQLVSSLLESPEQQIGTFISNFKSGLQEELMGDDLRSIQILGIPSLVYSGGPIRNKSTQN